VCGRTVVDEVCATRLETRTWRRRCEAEIVEVERKENE
jgi:hypothetical protein